MYVGSVHACCVGFVRLTPIVSVDAGAIATTQFFTTATALGNGVPPAQPASEPVASAAAVTSTKASRDARDAAKFIRMLPPWRRVEGVGSDDRASRRTGAGFDGISTR